MYIDTTLLTDLELAEVIMGRGGEEKTELLRKVLLTGSITRNAEELGLNEEITSRYEALLELNWRVQSRCSYEEIHDPLDVARLLSDIKLKAQEHFVTLTIDQAGRLITKRLLYIGTQNACVVSPADVFGPALEERAAGILLAHTHPSGKLGPSHEDRDITERLVRVGKLVGIEVVDHVIVGSTGLFSFKQEGLIDQCVNIIMAAS